jgi:cytochrome c oxidase subunit 2
MGKTTSGDTLRRLLSGIAGAFLAAAGAGRAQTPGDFWLPDRASTTAGEVDWLFLFIFYISVLFFLLIVGVMIVFLVRYRRRRQREAEESPSHNLALEITWSVIPVAVVIAIFAIGFKSFLDMASPPGNAYEISVVGQKWNWNFTYPDGTVAPELHVPVDRPVKLVLTSEDVIHSLFIPAFRLKRDAVPGRYTTTWFRATKPGQYPLLCAEYCGTGHSDMLSWVVVHEPGGFESWLAEAGSFLDKLPPAEAGERIYQSRGCAQCHSVDGSARVGPTFRDLYGSTRPLAGGGTVLADENYIRESVLAPLEKVAAGYEPVMPTYQGKLSDQEITVLIAYLKQLAGVVEEAAAEGAADAAAQDVTPAQDAGAAAAKENE